MYRNLTKFLLLACVTAVTLAIPSVASADPSRPALPVIDDGRWGQVPSSCSTAGAGSGCDNENLITIDYTRHLPDGGGYVYGRCTIQKRASLRYVWNWSQHIMYGDVYASCPADATGQPGIVLPTCTWVGNFRGHTGSSIEFLGSFSGEGESVGKSCFRWSTAATSSPGNDPQNGVYEGQGSVELYTAPGVEFGWTGFINGQFGHQDVGRTYNGDGATLHFETKANRPTPPRDPQQRNFVRATVYDVTGFWSSTPFQWCQGPCPAPPPLPPDQGPTPEGDDGWPASTEASSAGPPSSAALTTARRRAEAYWNGRGQLSACMRDDIRVVSVGPDDRITEKNDHGTISNFSLRELGGKDGRPPAWATVVGCNVKFFHNGPVSGYVTDPRIILNRTQNWPTKKLCTILTHELGHADRAGTHLYGYTHAENGGLEIMKPGYTQSVNPNTWPPCQSG